MRDSAARIEWKLHLNAAPHRVYACLREAAGRRRFWAESAAEHDGVIEFVFPDGTQLTSRILAAQPGRRFRITYFENSTVSFDLSADGRGGTDLVLVEEGLTAENWTENRPGWVSVLLCLKAFVDHGVDLRNHDSHSTWRAGFVDG